MRSCSAIMVAGALWLLPALAASAAGGAGEEGVAEAEAAAAGAAMGSQYQEAPMLAALVAAGELPPVDERLPLEPPVAYFAADDEIGSYGGTLTVFHTGINPWADLGYETEIGGYVMRANPDIGAVEPLLVRRAELAGDAKSVTFYLREGLKWSDGHPLTADDFVFMYEDAHWNDKVTTWNWIPQITRAIKIDDLTVRFETDEPYPALLAKHASPPGGGVAGVPSLPLPQEVAHRTQPGSGRAGQGGGLRELGQSLQSPLLLGPAAGPGAADPPSLDPGRAHPNREALPTQSLLLEGRSGGQPTALRGRHPGADRGSGDLPPQDHLRRIGLRGARHPL